MMNLQEALGKARKQAIEENKTILVYDDGNGFVILDEYADKPQGKVRLPYKVLPTGEIIFLDN
jgi:hypothetical protein